MEGIEKLLALLGALLVFGLVFVFRKEIKNRLSPLPKPEEVQNPKFDINEPYFELRLDQAQVTRGGKNQRVLLTSLVSLRDEPLKFSVSKDSFPMLEVYDFRDERRIKDVVEQIPQDDRRSLVMRGRSSFAFPHITIFEHMASNLDLTQSGGFHIYNHHQKFIKLVAGVYRVRAIWRDPLISDLQLASNFIELKLTQPKKAKPGGRK